MKTKPALPGHDSQTVARFALRRAIPVFAFLLFGLPMAPAELGAQSAVREAALRQQATESRIRGDADAPVVVLEIADFQCPFCARFSSETFPMLDSAYVQTGKVQWIFVNLPLPSHPRAWSAAKTALCAGAVGDRFWPVQHRLFAEQQAWSTAENPFELFLRYAADEELPADDFRDCLFSDKLAPVLLEDVLFVASARINGTPTFIIDRENVVVGLRDFDEWSAILDEAIQRKTERP